MAVLLGQIKKNEPAAYLPEYEITGKTKGWIVRSKFNTNWKPFIPVYRGLFTKKEAYKYAMEFYNFVKKSKSKSEYEKLANEYRIYYQNVLSKKRSK